jgi:uncharacterized membrane protein YgaE (UPF0421/DUF939 family)
VCPVWELILWTKQAGVRDFSVMVERGTQMATNGVRRDAVAGWVGWAVLVHSARTAVAAIASVLVARLFRLQEAYWAPITTLVITQSSLGAALAVSWQRFFGTALGAVVGAITASRFGPNLIVFGVSVFILGLVCWLARADRSAYRFGGITLAIVLLIPRTGPAWPIAFHRFAEVSIGIAVALILTAVWPESEVAAVEKKVSSGS